MCIICAQRRRLSIPRRADEQAVRTPYNHGRAHVNALARPRIKDLAIDDREVHDRIPDGAAREGDYKRPLSLSRSSSTAPSGMLPEPALA
jgi:hypothetical protein